MIPFGINGVKGLNKIQIIRVLNKILIRRLCSLNRFFKVTDRLYQAPKFLTLLRL